MRLVAILCALLFQLMTAVPDVTADELRLATVDMGRIMNESKSAQAKKKELDLKSAAAKKKLEDKQASLRTLEKSLKDAKVSEDSKEAENFRNQARDFSRMVKDTEEQLRKEFMKTNKALLDDTVKRVEQYAKKNSIQLVLDKSQQARGPVLFGVDSADITDQIIAELNK